MCFDEEWPPSESQANIDLKESLLMMTTVKSADEYKKDEMISPPVSFNAKSNFMVLNTTSSS